MSAHFEVFEGKTDGDWRWRLVAGNGETVAASEGYTSPTDAERGCEDAARAAHDARRSTSGEAFASVDVRRV